MYPAFDMNDRPRCARSYVDLPQLIGIVRVRYFIIPSDVRRFALKQLVNALNLAFEGG